MATPYKIQLPVYEGPLDLLLDLIRKQEIDIHNIPIAKITQQYLDYLHQLEKLDIDVSSDFLYMAASLIYIKSKMLLPVDPLAGPEEQLDPREDLVHRLLEHEKYKNAAQLSSSHVTASSGVSSTESFHPFTATLPAFVSTLNTSASSPSDLFNSSANSSRITLCRRASPASVRLSVLTGNCR